MAWPNPLGYSEGLINRQCPSCRARLGRLVPREKYFTSTGEPMNLFNPLTGLRLLSDRSGMVQCPDCKYTWPIFAAQTAGLSPSTDTQILETVRSEEPLGAEERVVDNSRSATSLRRSFTIRKEWTKEIQLESEAIGKVSAGVPVPIVNVINVEAQLRRKYLDRREEKEIFTEEVVIEIPPHTKTRVVFSWKRLWQHGQVRVLRGEQVVEATLYKITVGVTFDQSQVDET